MSDEDVPGWKVGSSVAYCESCFEEKMTKEMNYEEDLQKQASGSKIQGAGLSAKTDPLKSKRHLDQKHDEDFEIEDDDDEEERDEDVEFALAHFLTKGKGKSSKIPEQKP